MYLCVYSFEDYFMLLYFFLLYSIKFNNNNNLCVYNECIVYNGNSVDLHLKYLFTLYVFIFGMLYLEFILRFYIYGVYYKS